MIATRSQTSSISDRRWELSRTPTPALAQPDQQVADGAPPGRIERARRLVEQQQAGRADERLREAEPLLHALRHRADPAPGHVRELDELEQLPPLRRAAGRAGEVLVQAQHLVRRAPVGEAEQLGEIAEPGVRLGAPGGVPADRHVPAGRADEAARDLHERRLAGAVRAEEAEELALRHVEVDAPQRLHRAIGLAQAANGQGERHAGVGWQGGRVSPGADRRPGGPPAPPARPA